METFETYLERKYQEIMLLNASLCRPQNLSRPRSVDEIIRMKFQLTAALRAEHELQDWKATETAWSTTACPASGPFVFSYDYQRADLSVSGPMFYELGAGCSSELYYSASGMAAISAVMLSAVQVLGSGEILAMTGSYAETLELIERFTPSLQIVSPELPLAATSTGLPRVLLLDSCLPATAFEAILRSSSSELDLLVFDTTCFAVRSGRIRRVLRWAQRQQVPVVMVRSHNKLDSLGAEYGRLGSVVFVRWKNAGDEGRSVIIERLTAEVRNAIRLFGGAALPAHFPPYVGREAYWMLTKKRVAAILRNGRRTARMFSRMLASQSAQLHFTHGLYVTLRAKNPLDEESARQTAEAMCRDLSRDGHAIRHAGSFGFDFATAEWVRDATTAQFSVRVAVPDLPTGLWYDLSAAIAGWWKKS
ncbi:MULTISPECIES: hypothetical protein [unclassified Bradyrhizobium]|uniref:hypothetical protein n=1 Tax=unclassified Bradyrhizobium TaxID=2631580 RepID=UPI0020B1A7BA|nr:MULTISPECIES: hypothetical protein [unclassified Bradyrhizobium]MCP3402062.1 hypothetical protein [Bradyrhizobium sp. CCGB20]MCP3410549.1 hypothetical protein [Bradyrhizobium sp. CCGB01]